MMVGIDSFGKRVVVGVLATALALGLCACQGGVYEKEVPPENSAASAADKETQFAEFQRLMESQADTFTYDYRETYTFDKGSEVEEGVVAYTAACDNEGDVGRQHIVCTDEDTVQAGIEYFWVGDRVISVDGDIAADMSAAYLDEERAMDKAAFFAAGEVGFSAETLSDVTQDNNGVTYHFAFTTTLEPLDGVGVVTAPTSARVSVRFSEAGELEQQTFEAVGMASDDAGTSYDATTSGIIDFSQWGATEVPEAPEPALNLTSTDLEAAKRAVQQSVEALPDNLTCVAESNVVANEETQASVHVELLRDGSDALLYVETNGNADAALLTFYQGDENMVFQGDQFVSQGAGGLPEDATGTERALALVGLASRAYVYDCEDGLTQYALAVDGSDLPTDMSFDGVGSVGDIALYYWVDADGKVSQLSMEVDGVASEGQSSMPIVITTEAWYSDFGTTEVPPMPEGY